jgi:hypothetical protein
LALVAAAAGCSSRSNECKAICPVGCNISDDCQSCIPESDDAGLGTACNGPNDCCIGNCVGGICVATPDGGISDGGSRGGGASGGTSGGAQTGCQPWTNPSPTFDAACNPSGSTTEVCGPAGTCIPNCNDSAGYCGSLTCEVNGHCKAAGAASSGGSGGTTASSSGTVSGNSSSSGSGSSGFNSGTSSSNSGGSGGFCGQTGVASCTKSHEGDDCCSEYCIDDVCACNEGGGEYPCESQSDCCSGAICTSGVCL